MISWAKSIYHRFNANDPAEQVSKYWRGNRENKWFEYYTLDEEKLEFNLEEELELYVNIDIFAEGSFHTVYKAL